MFININVNTLFLITFTLSSILIINTLLMKKQLYLIILTIITLQTYAQRMDVDIFGNPRYESRDMRYSASLKEDIFNNLIFSDNMNNEITYEKKYLDIYFPSVSGNIEKKTDFLSHLIHTYNHYSNYKATFSVDIFNDVVIKDNRGNSVEIGTDIFGNPTYNERTNHGSISVKRDIFGNMEYKSEMIEASLKKDIFNKWTYTDNCGNKFEFGEKTWNKLIHKFGNDENIIVYLVDEFFRN